MNLHRCWSVASMSDRELTLALFTFMNLHSLTVVAGLLKDEEVGVVFNLRQSSGSWHLFALLIVLVLLVG